MNLWYPPHVWMMTRGRQKLFNPDNQITRVSTRDQPEQLSNGSIWAPNLTDKSAEPVSKGRPMQYVFQIPLIPRWHGARQDVYWLLNGENRSHMVQRSTLVWYNMRLSGPCFPGRVEPRSEYWLVHYIYYSLGLRKRHPQMEFPWANAYCWFTIFSWVHLNYGWRDRHIML